MNNNLKFKIKDINYKQKNSIYNNWTKYKSNSQRKKLQSTLTNKNWALQNRLLINLMKGLQWKRKSKGLKKPLRYQNLLYHKNLKSRKDNKYRMLLFFLSKPNRMKSKVIIKRQHKLIKSLHNFNKIIYIQKITPRPPWKRRKKYIISILLHRKEMMFTRS